MKSKDVSTWTHFFDMCSGGGQKERWAHIYIEAREEEARIIFYNRFGHAPDRVSCTCCGEDYSISSKPLDQLSGYERGCAFNGNCYVEIGDANKSYRGKYITIEEYMKDSRVKFIPSSEITAEERRGEVPKQGYIWQD